MVQVDFLNLKESVVLIKDEQPFNIVTRIWSTGSASFAAEAHYNFPHCYYIRGNVLFTDHSQIS